MDTTANSKLIVLLSSIAADEFKQLKHFVKSPFHNRNTKVVQLMEVLEQYYPKFNSPQLSREFLHAQVFSGKPFQDLEIRRTMSQLATVVTDFLAWSEIRKKPIELKVAQMKAIRRLGLTKHFDKTLRDATHILKHEKQTLNQNFYSYSVEQEREHFAEQHGARRSSTRLQEVSETLDLFYIQNKLKLACTAISYEKVFKDKYEIRLTDEVLELIEKTDLKDTLVNLYRYGLLTMTDPENEHHFKELKALLKQDLNLELREERDIHVLAQNYCIRSVNQGKPGYFRELFDVYRLGLEKEVIQSDLSQFAPAFKNIVSAGVKAKEYDWVENFILTYSDLLDKKQRSDYKNFNLARLRFDQGHFQETKRLLQEVKFKDVFITLNARVLLIKTFYELDQIDLAEHQIRNTKNFVSRQKNLSYHADIFNKVLLYMSRLVKLDRTNQEKVQQLIEEVRAEKGLSEKSWLLGKLG